MQLSSQQEMHGRTTLIASSARSAVLTFRVASVIAAAWIYMAAPGWSLLNTNETRRSAVNAIVSVDATLLGFLVSAGALLYAIANTRLAQNLMRTGHFNKVVDDMFWAAGAFLLAVVMGLIASVVNDPSVVPSMPMDLLLERGFYALLALNVAAFLLLLLPVWGLYLLLTGLQPEGGPQLQ